MLKPVEIRAARLEDGGEILRCLAEAFDAYRDCYTPAAFADTTLDPDTLQERMQTMHILVAMQEGAVIGTVAGSHDGAEGHLRGMAVLPEFAGSGVAAMLLGEIENWLRNCGCSRVTLDTTEPLTRATKFYEKNGYSPSGRVTDFYGMPLIEYEKWLNAQPKILVSPSFKTNT